MPGPTRVSKAHWYTCDTMVNATMSAPSTATNGVAIVDDMRGKYVHIMVTKSNVCNIDLYGYGNSVWSKIDSLQFSSTTNECELCEGLTSFDRVQPIITGLVATQYGCNTYIGLTDG